jgi:hypothetical protein
MVKTGMTGRLDPLNQVRELGNASGPPQGRSPAEINDLWSATPRALPGRLPLVFDRRVTKSAAGLIAPPHVQRVSVRKGLELPCL